MFVVGFDLAAELALLLMELRHALLPSERVLVEVAHERLLDALEPGAGEQLLAVVKRLAQLGAGFEVPKGRDNTRL